MVKQIVVSTSELSSNLLTPKLCLNIKKGIIMNIKKLRISIYLLILIALINSCGGGSSSPSNNNNSTPNDTNPLRYKLMNPNWEYSLGGSGVSNWVYTPAFNNNILYVTSFYNLYAINRDGTLKWSYDATPFNTSSMAISNNIIYLTQRDGSLSAIDENGSQIWRYDTRVLSNTYAHTPVIGCNDTLYFSTSYALYALNITKRSLKWKIDLDYTFDGSTIVDDSCTIYTSTSNSVIALETDGSIKWHYNIEDSYSGASAPRFVMDNDNNLYIKTRTTLTSIDKNGKFLWSYKDLKGNHTPVIDKNRVIYISDNTGVIYALNSDGSLKWKYTEELKDQYDSGVFLALSNDKIFINTYHQLYALSMDGKLIRQDLHLADVWSNPILVDDKLYVGEGIYLKEYTIENGGYQKDAQWPVEYYNNQHTRDKLDAF